VCFSFISVRHIHTLIFPSVHQACFSCFLVFFSLFSCFSIYLPLIVCYNSFPENVSEIREALGEFLTGHQLVESPYKTHFCISHSSKLLCKKKLTKEDVARFRSVIAKDYYFQMYFDDLPIWAFLGSVRSKWKTNPMQYFLYRHLHLDIFYNNHHVIEIHVPMDPNEGVDITEDREIEVEFTYSVMWRGTRTPFEKRMDKYLQSASMRYHHQVQWFSTMNSCVIVLLLTGFLATILMRVIKNDLIK